MKKCVLGIRHFLQVSGRSELRGAARGPRALRQLRQVRAAARLLQLPQLRREHVRAGIQHLRVDRALGARAPILLRQDAFCARSSIQGSWPSDAKRARASCCASSLGLAYVAVEDGEPWVACLPLAHPVLAAHASVSVYRRQKASRKGGQRKVRWGEGGQSHPQRLGEDNARARLRAEVGNGRWPIVDVNLRHTVPPQRLAAQALIAVVRRKEVPFVTAWDADLRSSRNPEAVTRLHRVLWEQRGLGRLEQQGARAASDGVCRARIRSLRARPRGWCRS